MQSQALLEELKKKQTFNRSDVATALQYYGNNSDGYSVNNCLNKMLRKGIIVRVGRNLYQIASESNLGYTFQHTHIAEAIAQTITENHPYLDFRVFELIQLNEFTNHQIAHNVIFLAIEGSLGDFVFDTLKNSYPGKVLLNPSTDTYHHYVSDETIVIEKLLSESPRGLGAPWHTRIEKWLVDLHADRHLQDAVNEGEYPAIFEDAFSKYAIDENTLFRYARRRNAENRIRTFIAENTNINLRLG